MNCNGFNGYWWIIILIIIIAFGGFSNGYSLNSCGCDNGCGCNNGCGC